MNKHASWYFLLSNLWRKLDAAKLVHALLRKIRENNAENYFQKLNFQIGFLIYKIGVVPLAPVVPEFGGPVLD